MIAGFTVGAVFEIVNKASPALATVLKQVRELNAAITQVKENLATLGKAIVPVGGVTSAVAQADSLAAAWGNVARNAGAARAAIGQASGVRVPAAAVAAGGGAGIGVGGGSGGGRRGLGNWLTTHTYGPGVPIGAGSHLRIGGPVGLAAGLVGYAGYQAMKYEDAAVLMAQHAGVDYKENRQKFRKILEEAAMATGYSEHDVSLAAQQELRMLGLTGGQTSGGGVDILPKMLRYAATEARLKGTGLAESMSSLTGLAHMTRQYGEKEIDKLVPAFSALSVRSPLSLAQQERAFGYAVPLLQTAMELDPMDVMAASTGLARAGITNTKAGTWIREMMVNAMPGTSLMSKMRFNKHEAALKELGLVDDQHRPTWFVDGKPNMSKFLEKTSENLPKIPITRRAAVETALAGKQGAGAIAVLSDPAVREQVGMMAKDMRSPETVARMRNFQTLYGEQSSLQSSRQTLQTFNALMADLGDKILPSVNSALGGFKSILEGIRNLIPGAGKDDGRSAAVIGGHGLLGMGAGAMAGGVYGAVGGPVGMVGGAAIGGVLGVAEGFMHELARKTAEDRGADNAFKAMKQNIQENAAKASGAKPEAVLAPIQLNLNIDGNTMAQALSTAAAKLFQNQAPAADGMSQWPQP